MSFSPQVSIYFCRGHSGDGVNNVAFPVRLEDLSK